MTTEEDIVRLMGSRHDDTSESAISPELDDAWALIVAARTLVRDHPGDADKRACAQRLEGIAAKRIKAAGREWIRSGEALLFVEPLEGSY